MSVSQGTAGEPGQWVSIFQVRPVSQGRKQLPDEGAHEGSQTPERSGRLVPALSQWGEDPREHTAWLELAHTVA